MLLDTEAASDVVISVSSDNTDVTVSPATLTFTTANWGTAQTVTVRAAHDADAVNDAASITHAVVDADSDDLYDDIARVSVTVTDDDAGVSVSETALTVAEGGTTYTVKLDAQPASDVVITVSSDNSDVTADTDAATGSATLTPWPGTPEVAAPRTPTRRTTRRPSPRGGGRRQRRRVRCEHRRGGRGHRPTAGATVSTTLTVAEGRNLHRGPGRAPTRW